MKVLMAIDGSKNAITAMLSASRILLPQDREVDLMCVAPETRDKQHPLAAKMRRRVAHILDAARNKLAAEGVCARTIAETGSPPRKLIAASLYYDVTAIGAESHRNSWVGLGPVAGRVVEHSNGNVLIGRGLRGESGLRILVPVDGSDGSLRAVEKIPSLVDLSGADITLLHVTETPWLHAGQDQEWLGYEEPEEAFIDPQVQFEREFVQEAESIVEAARQRLPGSTAVNTLIYEGLPAQEILGEAERGDYDLVVMGASGVVDLKHQMLGSVSSAIAWNAPCSVLLIRSGD